MCDFVDEEELVARAEQAERERDEARRQLKASMQIRREEGESLGREILTERERAEQAEAEVERLRGALRLALDACDHLSDQQAMPDDSWLPSYQQACAALRGGEGSDDRKQG